MHVRVCMCECVCVCGEVMLQGLLGLFYFSTGSSKAKVEATDQTSVRLPSTVHLAEQFPTT